jgi:two-component system sensor histidine kinase/response regulator
MFRAAIHRLYSLGTRVANIGVTDSMNFHEKTKTQVINIVVASGFPLNLGFGIVNFIQHKPLLGTLNMLLNLGGLLILVVNSYGKLLLSRLILTFLACILFTAQAILFRNGGEYYLVANLIIIIIYFNEKKYLVSIALVSCACFIGVKIFLNTNYIYGTVPFGRVIFNICWALLTMILALWFFKTEQLSYQKQVEEKNLELQKLNDTKQKLFSIIAHDLRSPIAQLKGSLDLVDREYISQEKFRETSARLSSEVDQLHSTLDNLLKWSVSQLQGIKVNPERISVAQVLEKKLDLFRQKADQKNITIRTEGNREWVLADRDHLLLVLRNLISNAIKYSHKGGTITLKSQSSNNRVIITVTDSGTGMTDDLMSTLFGSENIISHNGTADEKGTGLGLKLCREFIEKNQGSIWAESLENKGSSFFISLPEANK